MSIWSDIHKRSNGKQLRKEEKYLDEKDIIEILTNMVVHINDVPGEYPPIRQHDVTIKTHNGDIVHYGIVDTATLHPDGRKDYNSPASVGRLKNMIKEYGQIIEIK